MCPVNLLSVIQSGSTSLQNTLKLRIFRKALWTIQQLQINFTKRLDWNSCTSLLFRDRHDFLATTLLRLALACFHCIVSSLKLIVRTLTQLLDLGLSQHTLTFQLVTV
ncbi:hypothetical protein D3C78_1134800 [compost metagenome]